MHGRAQKKTPDEGPRRQAGVIVSIIICVTHFIKEPAVRLASILLLRLTIGDIVRITTVPLLVFSMVPPGARHDACVEPIARNGYVSLQEAGRHDRDRHQALSGAYATFTFWWLGSATTDTPANVSPISLQNMIKSSEASGRPRRTLHLPLCISCVIPVGVSSQL